MPIRPKAMPRLHVEISDCMETTLHVFFVCNPQMTWGVSLYCFHDLSSGSSLMMYKDMQGCTKLCNAHNQIIGCRKKHCTKTNACQRILSLQKCMWNFVKNIWNIISLSLHMLSSQEYSHVFDLLEMYCFGACENLRWRRGVGNPHWQICRMSMASTWTLAESFNPMYFWHHYKSKPVHQCYIHWAP